MPTDIRRAADRFRTVGDGIETMHSFSFGRHYDPANTSFGRMVAHDEHLLQPGSAFAEHEHRNVEIVTLVLEGSLAHHDNVGNEGTINPGEIQHLTAGTGIRHSERNAGSEPLRFVQVWLLPLEGDLSPAYRRTDMGELAVGHDRLRAVTLAEGDSVRLPGSGRAHVFVARGHISLEVELQEGDAARIESEHKVLSGEGLVLVWELADDSRAMIGITDV